ncbi:NUDIX domain-containing protein [Paenibacillus thailandensis]|uniref:NUDIX domain-containing protein n=1 Tax=Paenibacillus thailandensis TaxID=393250 RepID=A0ABW5QUX6_9BACL
MKPLRNSAKAIIIQDGKVLLTQNKDDFGLFYLFPGGGQDHGEELKDTVRRECLEEIGQDVTVHDLVYVREYIGKNHEFSVWDSDVHQVEFYFQCDLLSSEPSFEGATNPDKGQIGVEWVELNHLDVIRLYPKVLAERLKEAGERGSCYLGDAN